MRSRDNFIEGAFSGLVPVPRILESLDLRLRAFARRCLEQHIVRGVRVERRVEIDQVDAFVFDRLA